MPKFFTKDGWLTPYAMTCGYLHRQTNKVGNDIVFSMPSVGFYRVEQFDSANRLLDREFHSIVEARKNFKEAMFGKLQTRFEKAIGREVVA